MSKTTKQEMNLTFQRVAALCGLRLSLYTTAALLAVSFFILVATEYRTASPLYILLFLAVGPSLLHTMLFSSQHSEKKKRENHLAFPLFCEKYRYSYTFYKAMNLAYLFVFILLAAWHISYIGSAGYPSLITVLPMGTAALSLVVRLFGTLGYRFYFHHFPFRAIH